MARKNKNQHFRELASRMYAEHEIPPDFNAFAEDRIVPALELKGYKLDEKRRLAVQAAYNLVNTGLMGATVADARDWAVQGAKQRAEIWDALIAAGFAQDCRGSEAAKMVTRYRATAELLELRKNWEMRTLFDLHLHRNSELAEPTRQALVYLHSGTVCRFTGQMLPEEEQRQLIALNGTQYVHPAGITHHENLVEQINQSNLQHTWRATHVDPITGRSAAFEPNPGIRQVHAGKMWRATRYYSWGMVSGQNLPRAIRQTMLIDGEPAAELDYAGMATRMLYRKFPTDRDVYKPEKILPRYHGYANATDKGKAQARELVKAATNICWNVSSRGAANSAIAGYMATHPDGKFLRKLLYDVERSSPADLIGRIMAAHTRLSRYFFSQVGTDLMTKDGTVMMHLLVAFIDAGKPALAIHDSVVCRASDVAFAEEQMGEAYRYVVCGEPVIHRVF